MSKVLQAKTVPQPAGIRRQSGTERADLLLGRQCGGHGRRWERQLLLTG